MQEFKRKKEYFDSQIHDLEIASDQSDKFFNTLSNLQIIEKRKIEEQSTLIACQEYLYNKKNTFKDAVDGLKFALAKDIQQSKSRIEFYDRLKESNKLVSKHCANTLKNKNEIYKHMDREYHYLKKQQEIEGKRKIEIERELPVHKTQKTKDALIRTESKLQACIENTNNSLRQFYQKYQEAQNHKHSVMDPVISGLANFNKNYYDQMNKNYSQINFPYTNQINPNQVDFRNSEVISNYQVNQKPVQSNQDLQRELLQSNHSNKQDNIRGSIQSQRDSYLNQNIYMKNDQYSPKTASFKKNNTNVIQHYDPPVIHKDSNMKPSLPVNLNYNQPDNNNQIPYMMNNSQNTGTPINDLVTPFMNTQLTENKMKDLFVQNNQGNQQNPRIQNEYPQRQFNNFNTNPGNYQHTQQNNMQTNRQYNPQQSTTLSFGQFQRNSQQQNAFQNNNQQQSQYESQKQSQYEQNYFPFQESKRQSDYEQQNDNLNVFSFKEPKLHPQRITEALKSSDDFFYR